MLLARAEAGEPPVGSSDSPTIRVLPHARRVWSVNVSVMSTADACALPLLGQILREVRQRAGVSQRQLAIRTGIAAPAISRIENGHESPSFERFVALLQALGFEPSVQLRELSGSRADPVHLAAEAQLTPSQRLESLFEWMRFGDRLARAELRPLAPREG